MILGTMVTDPSATARLIGLGVHLIVSGVIAFSDAWSFENVTHRSGWLTDCSPPARVCFGATIGRDEACDFGTRLRVSLVCKWLSCRVERLPVAQPDRPTAGIKFVGPSSP